jgi:hypothetical protein
VKPILYRLVTGHDFSRAASVAKSTWASAPAGCFSHRSAPREAFFRSLFSRAGRGFNTVLALAAEGTQVAENTIHQGLKQAAEKLVLAQTLYSFVTGHDLAL